MCLIVFSPSPATHQFAHDLLLYHWATNPDGAGIAGFVFQTTNWIVKKGLMTEKEFSRAWKKLNGDFKIGHIRYATHGEPSPELTHPFSCGDQQWLFHNGVCAKYHPPQTGESDSAALARYLRKQSSLADKIEHLRFLAKEKQGRFALLLPRGRIYFFGSWTKQANGIMTSWPACFA